ncbi:hypothetical protein HMPREF0663_10298 [Hoylesella oralis ATCC 33269]|uniref:Uncharacterized protein n=1 Tax=Hoylesella oralis ATCC 33269 TaxID=873533 RepID=E7RME8_9BACT|nr:hypothetical protein HMPREF0663_10298 [Hoylesella oralis ATCC 33269]
MKKQGTISKQTDLSPNSDRYALYPLQTVYASRADLPSNIGAQNSHAIKRIGIVPKGTQNVSDTNRK